MLFCNVIRKVCVFEHIEIIEFWLLTCHKILFTPQKSSAYYKELSQSLQLSPRAPGLYFDQKNLHKKWDFTENKLEFCGREVNVLKSQDTISFNINLYILKYAQYSIMFQPMLFIMLVFMTFTFFLKNSQLILFFRVVVFDSLWN